MSKKLGRHLASTLVNNNTPPFDAAWYAIEHDTTDERNERNERTPDEDGPDGIYSFLSSDAV